MTIFTVQLSKVICVSYEVDSQEEAIKRAMADAEIGELSYQIARAPWQIDGAERMEDEKISTSNDSE